MKLSKKTKINLSVLKALANDKRMAIFMILCEKNGADISASEIATRMGMLHNTLSGHLLILLKAELITFVKIGREHIYLIDNDNTFKELIAWLKNPR